MFSIAQKTNQSYQATGDLYAKIAMNAKQLGLANKQVLQITDTVTPIEVLAHFEESGTPHPLRLKPNGKELKIEQILSTTEEKLAGNRMLVFRCQSEIKGELRPFEIKYELNTCKWFLYKM